MIRKERLKDVSGAPSTFQHLGLLGRATRKEKSKSGDLVSASEETNEKKVLVDAGRRRGTLQREQHKMQQERGESGRGKLDK